MKRITEFEKLLTDKVSVIESQDVNISDFDRFLSSEGCIIYTYTSISLGCKIEAFYKGRRFYEDEKINLKLTLNYSEQ